MPEHVVKMVELTIAKNKSVWKPEFKDEVVRFGLGGYNVRLIYLK
jgi:hypothetical protein